MKGKIIVEKGANSGMLSFLPDGEVEPINIYHLSIRDDKLIMADLSDAENEKYKTISKEDIVKKIKKRKILYDESKKKIKEFSEDIDDTTNFDYKMVANLYLEFKKLFPSETAWKIAVETYIKNEKEFL